MEVKEFVKTILKEVTEAVVESKSDKSHFYFNSNIGEGIDFDLAVISKKEGSGKIWAEVLGIGGNTGGSVSKEVVNRIKFRVHASLKN